MINLLTFIGALALVAQAVIGLFFLISCIQEKEKRATLFALFQFLGMTVVLIIYLLIARSGFFHTPPGVAILIAGTILTVFASWFLVRRTEPNEKALQGTKGLISGSVKRFDERMHVFARNRAMRPGTDPYKAFYGEHPELEEFDGRRRGKGGPLGHLGSIDKPHEGPNVAGTLGSLSIPFNLSLPHMVKPQQHPELKGRTFELSPEEASRRLKGYAKNLGADLVGIAEINPHWVYSHRGEIFHENWEDWGGAIPLDHKYAVVVVEEMAFDMVGAAPHTPSVMESMKNYAKGAYISTQIAGYIANLGFGAAANHLRHYTAILPPLAVDAGLGEVGRLGYLMTKEFGPRIRLSAVTTDMPLIPDKPVDIGAEDFCRICKKCATCCPSRSIPEDDDLNEHNGTLRWKLDAESCFEYWGKIGTDCCVCMKVCPWSHARTWPHRLIVWLISRNKYSRRLFNRMDDIFYGRKPKPKKGPKWAQYAE